MKSEAEEIDLIIIPTTPILQKIKQKSQINAKSWKVQYYRLEHDRLMYIVVDVVVYTVVCIIYNIYSFCSIYQFSHTYSKIFKLPLLSTPIVEQEFS